MSGRYEFNYISPKQAAAIDDRYDEAGWIKLAKKGRTRKCQVCDQPVWVFGDCGMCFPCTTGESDPSGDYEVSL